MEEILPVLVFGGIIVAVIAAIGLSIWFEKKRTEGWQTAADELGYQFIGKTSPGSLPNVGRFKVFNKGSSRKVRNAISGSEGATEITLADYSYTTGSGKNRTTHSQTLCLLQSAEFSVPHCFLRPEVKLFDFLGKMFGGQDINFDDDPEFSKAFVLQGDDEAAVRELFQPKVRDFFVANKAKGWQFEASGDAVCFHNGRRIKPAEASSLLADGLEVVNLLRSL